MKDIRRYRDWESAEIALYEAGYKKISERNFYEFLDAEIWKNNIDHKVLVSGIKSFSEEKALIEVRVEDYE